MILNSSSMKDKWEVLLDNEHTREKTLEGTKEFYNVWAKEYDDTMYKWGMNTYINTSIILMGYAAWPLITGTNLRVLDLGCGTGLLGDAIRKFDITPFLCGYDSIKITGIDISTESLKIADKKSVYDELIFNDIHDALTNDLNDSSFDVICAITVLGYLDFQVFYEESRRVVKDSGIIIFTCKLNSPTIDFITRQYNMGYIRSLKLSQTSVYPNNPMYSGKYSYICVAQIHKANTC